MCVIDWNDTDYRAGQGYFISPQFFSILGVKMNCCYCGKKKATIFLNRRSACKNEECMKKFKKHMKKIHKGWSY